VAIAKIDLFKIFLLGIMKRKNLLQIMAIILCCAKTMVFSACEKEKINSTNYTKRMYSIGVFGGSVSMMPESEIAKAIWKEKLAKDSIFIQITTCGVGGCGFSNLAGKPTVPQQIINADTFDVYILWCSTNDVYYCTSPGETGDTNLTTQSGGLLKSIELIKERNADALILLFTSLPRFDGEGIYNKMPVFVEGQKSFCTAYHIPYLDMWSLCGFDWDNYAPYYLPDKVHLTHLGYTHMADMQVEFIKNFMRKKDSETSLENPINVDFENNAPIISIRIFNLQGVFVGAFREAPLRELNIQSGMYIIQKELKSGKTITTKEFIIEEF